MLDICSTSIILTLLQNFKRLSACLINIHIPQASHWHHIAARLGADENGTLGPVLKTFRDSERMCEDVWVVCTWKWGKSVRAFSLLKHVQDGSICSSLFSSNSSRPAQHPNSTDICKVSWTPLERGEWSLHPNSFIAVGRGLTEASHSWDKDQRGMTVVPHDPSQPGELRESISNSNI